MDYLTISGDDVSSVIAIFGDVFAGIKPLIFLVIGLFLGFWILEALIGIFVKRREKITEMEEWEKGIVEAEEKKLFEPYLEKTREQIREETREKWEEETEIET